MIWSFWDSWVPFGTWHIFWRDQKVTATTGDISYGSRKSFLRRVSQSSNIAVLTTKTAILSSSQMNIAVLTTKTAILDFSWKVELNDLFGVVYELKCSLWSCSITFGFIKSVPNMIVYTRNGLRGSKNSLLRILSRKPSIAVLTTKTAILSSSQMNIARIST